MTALEVDQCGLGASVQDTGRYGHRRYGVSTAGVMDRRALGLANALVGNSVDKAVVELALSGASFRVSGGQVLLSVCGPGTRLTVSGQSIPEHTSAKAVDGDIVTVGPPRNGFYSYLAIAGGFQTASVLGSRSCHRRSGIGGNLLSKGDLLPCLTTTATKSLCFPEGVNYNNDDAIGIIPGPQFDMFNEGVWSQLLSTRYKISQRSDRMGICLIGPRLLCDKGHDIVSEGVVPGSIQVPGDGTPIVLGRDCQTVGGYPKIATVISTDLDRIAQFPVGCEFRFRIVSKQEGFDAARRFSLWQNSLKKKVRPVGELTSNLFSHNLISGVTKGDEI